MLVPGPKARAAPGITEVQFQFGRFDKPVFNGGGKRNAVVLTLQYAGGWRFGDIFGFADFQNFDDGDSDLYGELYFGFNYGKMTGRKLSWGPIRDIGLRMGVNWDVQKNIRKLLPGLRLSWKVPGFRYLNTDFYAYLGVSGGLASGGIPKQSDSWNGDINWAAPFKIGQARFSFEGHMEYLGNRRNEIGRRVSWWILGQPQFRFDLGNTLFGVPNKLFAGIEWQFWLNKLGDPTTDEQVVQALVVLRL